MADSESKNRVPHDKLKSLLLICIGLTVFTVAIYWQVQYHEFLHWDDHEYVTMNPHVVNGITMDNLVWAFTSTDRVTGNWHPITWVSHMADVQLFGVSSGPHHLVNVFFHAASSILLLLLLFRLTGSLWKSAFTAALFALHPLHVESVAWIAERKDVLSAFFWFITLIFYSEYVRRPKTIFYLLSLFSFVLGLMCKPMLVTLPVVMLLLDFWPLQRYRLEDGRKFFQKTAALLLEKIPFFVFSILSAVITVYAQKKGGAVKSLEMFPMVLRAENASFAYIRYILKTFWPVDLASLYPLESSIPLWQVTGSMMFLLLISWATFWGRRKYPFLIVGWFWFLITLLPVIGLVQVGVQSMADRYSYIPGIGLSIMVAWGVPELTKGRQKSTDILGLLACIVIIILSAITYHQLDYWKDDISLYQHTLSVTTDNSNIHYNLGASFAEKGYPDLAIQQYKEVLRIQPNNAYAHSSLGDEFFLKGNLDEAIKEYQAALRIMPNDVATHVSLGNLLFKRGNFDAAAKEFGMALLTDPNNADARNNKGLALANMGNLGAAIQEYQLVLRTNPNDARAKINLGFAIEKSKTDHKAR